MASPGNLNPDIEVHQGEIEHSSPGLAEQSQPSNIHNTAVTDHASPQISILEDLDNYELDDEEYGDVDQCSTSSSSGSSSGSDSPTAKVVEYADDEPEEFPFRPGRSVSGIQVTNTYSVERSPLPFFQFPPPPPKMPNPKVPKPGPAKLSPRAGLEEWLAEAKQCHYLPEAVMKQLCEMVKECLMEGEYQ
jgi:hypothetical protein